MACPSKVLPTFYGRIQLTTQLTPIIKHYKEFTNIRLDIQFILSCHYHMQLATCLVILNKSHKILIMKDNTWHQVAMVIT
jgi:hypothetical protein